MQKPLRVGFCGAHSTGKSTLAEALCLATGLPFISEITRQTPAGIRGTPVGQASILMDYVETFAHKTQTIGSWICDRTLIDVCCYSEINGVWGRDFSRSLLRATTYKPYAPTHLIYFPIEFPMIQDGERPPEEQRKELDRCARELVSEFYPAALAVTGSVAERLSQVKYYLGYSS